MSGNGIDDDNSDDEDEDERQRAKKRHSLRPSGVDDDNDNDLGNTSNGGSSMDDGGQDVDDNFFDLLQTFASLDFPDSDPQQPEKCPLCPLSFALDEFASHVLECITQLDDIEKEHVLKLDEKMAQEMAGGLPQTIHTSSFSHFSAPSTCKDGANCKRTDSSHFINVSHPKVDCFICGKGYQVYEINAHLNLCLTSSNRPPSSSSASPFASSPSSSSMRPVVNAMTTTPTPTPTAPPVFNFSTTSSSMRSSSVSAFDDDDDDDDNDSKSRANIGSTGTGISNSSASGDSGSSNSLNTRQMKAMAQLLLKEKDKAAPDLHAILDGFSKLGFNKKSLTQQMNESINANTNSTPSKSKDNNDNNDNAERR